MQLFLGLPFQPYPETSFLISDKFSTVPSILTTTCSCASFSTAEGRLLCDTLGCGVTPSPDSK